MAGVTRVNDQKENLIIRIRKRDGREVNFEPLKISDAIYKALVATGKPDFSLSEKLATKVVQKMIHHGYGSTEIPSVEDVQDMVESILIEEGLSETAKAYILYRHERRKLRDEKMKILNKYHFEAMIRHYIDLAKKEHMKITFKELLRLIAEGKFATYGERIKEYYNLMVSRDFLPNTPTLMNAGGRLGQLSACFVLDMPDDMQGIMK